MVFGRRGVIREVAFGGRGVIRADTTVLCFVLGHMCVCPSIGHGFCLILYFVNYMQLEWGSGWLWLYGSWIYNYLCNQCLSPLMLWVSISIRARCTTLCDKVCQWLAIGRRFSLGPPVSYTNKTDRHDIAEILLKVALNTISKPSNLYLEWEEKSFEFVCWCFFSSWVIWNLRSCLKWQIWLKFWKWTVSADKYVDLFRHCSLLLLTLNLMIDYIRVNIYFLILINSYWKIHMFLWSKVIDGRWIDY